MSGNLKRTLMCRDHEVVSFSYDPVTRRVISRGPLLDPVHLPLGCLGEDGRFTSARLGQWLSGRSIPATRPGVSSVLQKLDLRSPEELMTAGLGLSLSDQYWLRPSDFDGTWEEVNFFEHPFSPALGEALAPHDPDSGSAALQALDGDIMSTSTPDSSLNGNLPKRWEIIDGVPHLMKTGKPENLFQEPLNERIATLLCERILRPGEFVPYRLVENGYPRFVSTCPCMVDARTELVPAADIARSRKLRRDRSRYEQFVSTCEGHGISDAREQVDKMLVVDHILANFDRHWGNFGVLMDSETRTWKRIAPLFDMGESLWCDRPFANDFSSYRMPHPMPFVRDATSQMERYVTSAPWLDASKLDGFAEDAVEILGRNPLVAGVPGRVGGIRGALQRNISEACKLAGA